jgi:hypothetical protein
MYTVHLDTLGMVHEYRLIAVLYSFQCPANEMKMPPKTEVNG